MLQVATSVKQKEDEVGSKSWDFYRWYVLIKYK